MKLGNETAVRDKSLQSLLRRQFPSRRDERAFGLFGELRFHAVIVSGTADPALPRIQQ